jgi:hypothetical protein
MEKTITGEKKIFLISCLLGILFVDCVSTTPTQQSAKIVKDNYQNPNSEYGELYFDKTRRFSVYIPKEWKIISEDNPIILLGHISEYELGCSVWYLGITKQFSEFVDGAIESTHKRFPITESERGSINIHIGLKGECLKILQPDLIGSDKERLTFQKIYFIPHPKNDELVMITCATYADYDADYETEFDKFVKTFDWMR